MWPTTRRFGVKIGLAFWLLLAPGENWTWVIVGGHDVLTACEQERNERLDGDYLVCVATPPSTAAQPATAYRFSSLSLLGLLDFRGP